MRTASPGKEGGRNTVTEVTATSRAWHEGPNLLAFILGLLGKTCLTPSRRRRGTRAGTKKERGGGGARETKPVATLLPSTRMPPALSLAAMRAILTFDGLYQMVTVKVTRQCPTDNFH